jgi:hypothetical protein
VVSFYSLKKFGSKVSTSKLNGHLKKIGEVKTSPAKYNRIVMADISIRHPLVYPRNIVCF